MAHLENSTKFRSHGSVTICDPINIFSLHDMIPYMIPEGTLCCKCHSVLPEVRKLPVDFYLPHGNAVT